MKMWMLVVLVLALAAAGCQGRAIVFAGCAEIKALVPNHTAVVEVDGLTEGYVRVEARPGDEVGEFIGVMVYEFGSARRVNAGCNAREVGQ